MKKIIALTLLVFFLSGPSAFAHTGLESSTPAEGEVVTEELQEMVLAFNTELEKASSFTVKMLREWKFHSESQSRTTQWLGRSGLQWQMENTQSTGILSGQMAIPLKAPMRSL
ncbi:copper resistance protein CopC (plasmid) [Planococcus glaciei]|nr:copper resistance protein CopC [Planococcus glaciei]